VDGAIFLARRTGDLRWILKLLGALRAIAHPEDAAVGAGARVAAGPEAEVKAGAEAGAEAEAEVCDGAAAARRRSDGAAAARRRSAGARRTLVDAFSQVEGVGAGFGRCATAAEAFLRAVRYRHKGSTSALDVAMSILSGAGVCGDQAGAQSAVAQLLAWGATR